MASSSYELPFPSLKGLKWPMGMEHEGYANKKGKPVLLTTISPAKAYHVEAANRKFL